MIQVNLTVLPVLYLEVSGLNLSAQGPVILSYLHDFLQIL